MNKLLTFFILTLPLAFGYIYLPTRLYLIGQESREIIAKVEQKVEVINTGQSWMTVPYASVTLQNYPEPFPSPNTDYVVGQEVTLLYSDRLNMGIILPDRYSYFTVLYNSEKTYGFTLILQAIAIFIGLVIAIPYRTYKLASHILTSTAASWREAIQNKKTLAEKVVAVTDFMSQFTTMCIAVACVFVFVVLVVRIILLVEQTGLFLTTLTLIAASSLLLTPLLERIIDTIIKIKRNEIFKSLVLIMRNVVATVAGGILVFKLITFMMNEDFQKFETVKSVVLEFVAVLFS